MRMRWLLSRHAYIHRAEDFAVVVALLDLIVYVIVCSTAQIQLRDQNLVTAALVSSSILFVLALTCFVVIRMFRTSKYSVDSYIVPLLLIVNLSCTMYLQLTNENVGILSGSIVSYYFILTGYPYTWLLAFSGVGMCIGIVVRFSICSASLVSTCDAGDWVDVGIFASQVLLGTAFYFSLYELGVLILRYKKHPARHLDAFTDLTTLDALVFCPIFGVVSPAGAPQDGFSFTHSVSGGPPHQRGGGGRLGRGSMGRSMHAPGNPSMSPPTGPHGTPKDRKLPPLGPASSPHTPRNLGSSAELPSLAKEGGPGDRAPSPSSSMGSGAFQGRGPQNKRGQELTPSPEEPHQQQEVRRHSSGPLGSPFQLGPPSTPSTPGKGPSFSGGPTTPRGDMTTPRGIIPGGSRSSIHSDVHSPSVSPRQRPQLLLQQLQQQQQQNRQMAREAHHGAAPPPAWVYNETLQQQEQEEEEQQQQFMQGVMHYHRRWFFQQLQHYRRSDRKQKREAQRAAAAAAAAAKKGSPKARTRRGNDRDSDSSCSSCSSRASRSLRARKMRRNNSSNSFSNGESDSSINQADRESISRSSSGSGRSSRTASPSKRGKHSHTARCDCTCHNGGLAAAAAVATAGPPPVSIGMPAVGGPSGTPRGPSVAPGVFFAAFLRSMRRTKILDEAEGASEGQQKPCCCEGICDECAGQVNLRLPPFCTPQQQQQQQDTAAAAGTAGSANSSSKRSAAAAPCCEACAVIGCSGGASWGIPRGPPRRKRRVRQSRGTCDFEPITIMEDNSSSDFSDLLADSSRNCSSNEEEAYEAQQKAGGGVRHKFLGALGKVPFVPLISNSFAGDGEKPLGSPSFCSSCTLDFEGAPGTAWGAPGVFEETPEHFWEPPEGEVENPRSTRASPALRARTLSTRRSMAANYRGGSRGDPRAYSRVGGASGSSDTVGGERVPLADPLETAHERMAANKSNPSTSNPARRALHQLADVPRVLGAAGDVGVAGAKRVKEGLFGRRQTIEHRQARVLRYHLVQKAHDRMPWWLARLVACLDVALDNCRRRRKVMQKATWRSHVPMPVRNSFGLFDDSKLEHWYVQWLNAFNARYYVRITPSLLLTIFYGVITLGLYKLRGFLKDRDGSIKAVQNSSMGTSGFIMMVAFRFALQPLLTIIVLLPLLVPSLMRGRWYTLFFDSRQYSANGYVLNRLLIIASAIQLAFPLFDQSWHFLVTPGAESVGYMLGPKVTGPLQVALLQMTVFLVMRDPTFITACIGCFLALVFSFAFLFTSNTKTVANFFTMFFSFAFVAFTSRAFYTRTLEINRRRLFCKYVIPYIMYLEEVGIVLYAGNRLEDGDSESSGSFSSAPLAGLIHQATSHPSMRFSNHTKSFGPWKGGHGGLSRGPHGHGDRQSANAPVYLRPEASRLAT